MIVSRVETSLGCHDLRQPYFHKAVVLVLDHDPDDFTQGILLNRVSDLVLDDRDIVYVDEDNDGDETEIASQQNGGDKSIGWKIHFGGDIGGWYEPVPQLLCLHGISSDAALAVSDPLFGLDNDAAVPNVYVTSHLGAQSLVHAGEATSDMFYTFSGFCGWEEGQLQREVDRGSWCLASFVDDDDEEQAKTGKKHILMDLLQQHSWKNPDYQPPSAGLAFWHQIMAELGKDQVTSHLPQNPQPFSDLMVKEWATQRLVMNETPKGTTTTGQQQQQEPEPTSQIDDEDIFRALQRAADRSSTNLSEGSILRGSSAPSSPYLVNGQLFHKSTILVLQDSPEASIGVILNLPSKDAFVFQDERNAKEYTFPIRYGGPSGTKGSEEPYFWFHNEALLKNEGVGLPVSFSNEFPERASSSLEDESTIFVCDFEEVKDAILQGLARPDDFLLVQGFCAWDKQDNGSAGGLAGELLNGNLEDTRWLQKTQQERQGLWESLRNQKQLVSEECVKENLELAKKAWEQGGSDAEERPATETIRHVFDSDVAVSELADEALSVWMKIFLMRNNVYFPTDL